MRRKSHVRFGERDGGDRVGQPAYGAAVPTLRDPTPSAEDRAVTRQLRSAGSLLGIEVLDHIVVGDGPRYYSFSEAGALDHLAGAAA